MGHRILVVDDEAHIREVICFALEKAGHTPIIAATGPEALTRFHRDRPDLVILDIGLPGQDGLDVCRAIRKQSDCPILFLSARDEEIDRVLGFELGGDDYVTKPFSPRELVARVSAILKRGRSTPETAPVLAYGDLRLEPDAHRAFFAGAEVGLTGLEFAILRLLAARPAQVFTRQQILEAAYPEALTVSDRTIDSHIRNIRAKFPQGGVIDTVHGVGFRLGPCRAAP
jgi:two-component system OmpR family response regulator